MATLFPDSFKVSLIVPILNEEDAIPTFYQAVRENELLATLQTEIIFVNDGSQDKSEAIINALAKNDPLVVALSFTRHFGKEPAMFAGLEHSTGDVVIPIDVDLQDPIEVIPLLLNKYQEGYDVVLAKRIDRRKENFFKRTVAQAFYRTHNTISTLKMEENVGDFRLISRNVVVDITNLPEQNIFMKGLFAWVGGNVAIVEYTRQQRRGGKSKFTPWKLWNLALEGITSFSTLPLRIWSYVGALIALFAFIYAAILIVDKLVFGNPVPGYPSIMVSILF